MFKSSKTILSLSLSLFILTGCTIPGSNLSHENKKVYAEPKIESLSEEQKQNIPLEQVNVYPLSYAFVSAYSAYNNMAEGSPQINPQLDEAMSSYEYFVGTGDILNVTIWDHPELTIPAGAYRSAQEAGHWVHADGNIFYPYIGFVSVENKTIVDIRTEISKRLEEFIESPQVDVSIAGFRSQKAYITGEVKKSGKQAINNVPLTLLDAINNAGGITGDADWRNVTLTRNGETETVSLYKLMQKGDLTQNRLIQAGDIIHVPRDDAQKIFVLGEVKTPEMLKIDRAGMSLTEALSQVGGINELSADATGIFVVRSAHRDQKNESFLATQRARVSQGTQAEESVGKTTRPEALVANIYQLDIKDAAGLVLGTDFKLEPYDVVYVTAAPIERYNRVIRQLLPTLSGINQLSDSAVVIRNW